MGWKIARVNITGNKKMRPNEERDIVVCLEEETRAAIHGIVKLPDGKPVKNAVVKLFKQCSQDPCDLQPITFAFTDKCGQFLFGVPSDIDFVIKVFYYIPEKKACDKECDKDYDRDCD